jgi:quercetin dioxygenase-like cupin family protein
MIGSKLLVAASLLFVAQEYPPPFPREGATKLFENESVAVWDVTWNAGVPTPMHRHRLEVVGVTLVPGIVRVTLPDGTTRLSELDKVGAVSSGGMGLIHREEGTSAIPRRAVLIELKEARKPPPLTPPEGVPPAWPREGATKVLENDRVVVWDYEFRMGRAIPLHFHDKDTVVVELTPGVTRSVPRDGEPQETTWVGSRARFAPRGRIHGEEAVSGAPRAIAVEIK